MEFVSFIQFILDPPSVNMIQDDELNSTLTFT